MEYAERLSSDLIHDHFGDVVQNVWNCLQKRGRLQLGEIGRFTGLAPPLLRNSLLVLIQHNCVQAFRVKQEGAFGADYKQVTLYIAILDSVLHRLRFPKFLLLAQAELGEVAENLVFGLLQHGRLTLRQLLERAAECDQTGLNSVEPKEAFAALLRSRYVERCPLSEPELKNAVDEQPKKKPRTAKARVPVIAPSLEHRVTTTATPAEGERFQIPAFLLDQDDQRAPEPSVGQKRRRRLEMNDEGEVAWRVNNEEFLRRLRHQACVKFVTSRAGLGAGTVLSCMLDATRKTERTLKERVSDALTMDAITQAVIATPAGRTMTLEQIRPALIQMVEEGFVDRVGDTASQYAINMQTIIERARQNQIEGVVLQRFGRKGCRIFKLLSKKGSTEQKQISDILGPPKETWALLYQLMREKYIEYQDIYRSADRAPSKSFYLWYVNTASVSRNLLSDMYHALFNMGRRLAHELEQEQELLTLLKSGVSLTGMQRQQATRLSNIAKVLEVSILKLDDDIMLFHDF